MTAFAELDIAARTDQLAKANRDLESLVSAASRAEDATGKVSNANATAEASFSRLQQQIAMATGILDKSALSAKASALAFDELARMAANIDNLRASVDPIYASSMRYAQALEQLDEALQRGVISQRQYNIILAQAGRTYLGVSDSVSNAGRGMSVAGGGARMLAQQLSQVAQQGAATGQWMQALTIQAADIGMAFGTIGAIAGTLATIAMPALISALSNTGGQAAEVEAALDALSEATDTYREAVDALGMSSVQMAENYGTMTGAAREFLAAMAETAQFTAYDSLRQSIETLTGPMLSLQQFADDGSASWYRLAEQLGVTQQQADWLSSSLQYLASAGGPEQQAAAAQALADRLMAAAGSYENMNASSRMLYDNAVKIGLEAAKLVGTTESAGRSANTMAGFFDSARQAAEAAATAAAGIGNAAAGAIGQVQGLAKAMWDAAQGRIAANKAIDAMQVGGVGSGGGTQYLASQYALYGQGRVAGDTPEKNADLLYNPPAIGTGVGSGAGSAGGGVDPFQARLDALTSQFEAERELVDTWYEESQAILADRRAMEILGAEEHARIMLAVEEEMVRRKMELRDQDLSHFESFFGSMAGAFSSGGERMLKISKAFGLAEAAVSIWRGAAKALELPFPENLAAWGQVIATGAKALTGIKSASPGSSAGLGGASAGGGRMATAEPAAQNRFLRIEVNGEGMFAQALRDNVQSIADAITDLSGRGGTTLVVGR